MVLLTLLRRTDNSYGVNIPQVCLTVYVFQVVKELVASATSKDFPKGKPFQLAPNDNARSKQWPELQTSRRIGYFEY